MTRAISPARLNRRRPAGTTLVEAAFVLVLFLAFICLIMDTSWALFAKATLQHAVRSGVRYAVTSQTATSGGKQLGQIASIKQVVQTQAMGFLSASDMSSVVNVTFYAVNSNPPKLLDPTKDVNVNAANNLVVVSVQGFNLNPLAPLLHSADPIVINVSSGDLIESSGPGGITPPL